MYSGKVWFKRNCYFKCDSSALFIASFNLDDWFCFSCFFASKYIGFAYHAAYYAFVFCNGFVWIFPKLSLCPWLFCRMFCFHELGIVNFFFTIFIVSNLGHLFSTWMVVGFYIITILVFLYPRSIHFLIMFLIESGFTVSTFCF